jgi:hypothetical protein
VSLILLGPIVAQALPLSPQDFASGVPITTTKDAAAYRFALPIAVYQNTYRDDIGDMRLFNAEGNAVPSSLLRPTAQSPIHKVTRVNVLLPEPNTVISMELTSRRTPRDPWRPVTRAGFYRLKTPDGEQQNAPLEVATDVDRYWHAHIIGSDNLPHKPLRLRVEWVPNEVTFLARGQGPYLLAYGNATVARADTDLSQIPSTLEIAPATVGSPQVLGG